MSDVSPPSWLRRLAVKRPELVDVSSLGWVRLLNLVASSLRWFLPLLRRLEVIKSEKVDVAVLFFVRPLQRR